MKRRLLLSSMVLCIYVQVLVGQVSPHVIAFFIRPLPVAPSASIQKAIEEQKKIVGSSQFLEPIISKVLNLSFLHAGMYASYAGTITHSSPDGKIIFERKASDPRLVVLITNNIKPIPISPYSEKTLTGFVISPKAHAQHYLFERMQDPETETYAWYVSAIKVDRDKRIPSDTIILYADPRHVIVPLGPSATKMSENFVLPDFYVTEEYNSAFNALSFLKIRQYFAPVSFDYSFLPQGYQKKISA